WREVNEMGFGGGTASRPQRHGLLLFFFFAFLASASAACVCQVWPMTNGGLTPTKIVSLGPLIPDDTPSRPARLMIPPILSVCCTSGPETAMSVTRLPLANILPHSYSGFISAERMTAPS